MALLLIEDDKSVQDLVGSVLKKGGFSVDVAGDGKTGLLLGMKNHYDVIILDLGLPDIDGLEVLRQMRDGGVTSHVLILTSRDDPEDRITGLDAGADDYVSKPCVLRELEARVRALIRRKHQVKNPLITVADLVIDTSRRAVTRAGKGVALTPREYALLEFLAMKAGVLVTRQEIWENLYAMDTSSSSNVVDVYIGYLRKKLEWPGVEPLIHTRRGVGFILGLGEGAP